MKRFFECLIPITACNLKCSYCYIIQEGRRKNEKATLNYSPEIIGQGLSIRRLGGISLISITGSGETLIPKELPQIIFEILKQGHYINITTNGTITNRFDEILKFPTEYLSRLHFSFSFHYLELLRARKLNDFFQNIDNVRKKGCSFLLQINLSDEYIPHWETIKKLCKEKVGSLPQVALTRDESGGTYKILTKLSDDEYFQIGNEMDSPLFKFTCENFMVKRKEFCYAGMWSCKLNLATGLMTGCYGNGLHQNIFQDITKPIQFQPIGRNCTFKYCFNSSHFLSLGVIPSIKTPSYGDLRNRPLASWYSNKMHNFLNERLYDNNDIISPINEIKYDVLAKFRRGYNKINSLSRKIQHYIRIK